VARIIFLGTAGSSAVATKNLRSSGGIILQLEDLQFHLDPGPGSLSQAKEYGINLNHNTAVLVSHCHMNHCNDLNSVIEAMTHGGLETRGVVAASKSVLTSIDGGHPFLTKHHQSLLEKVIPLEKNHKLGIDLVEINALPASHTDKTAVGFKFFCPKFTLSYTGDTSLTVDLIEGLMGSDILILNVPYPGDRAQGKNLDSASAIQIISKVQPKLAIITHFGLEMLKADPLQEAREIQRLTGVQTIAAIDGLVITPESYGNYKGPVKGYVD
jgi:ribonuclease BN (tRNA processing enzyme)